jgi:hypothetical protein
MLQSVLARRQARSGRHPAMSLKEGRSAVLPPPALFLLSIQGEGGLWIGRQHTEEATTFMMRRALAVLALALPVLMPSPGFAQNLDLHLGGYFPSANSNLFGYDESVYTVSKSDFNGVIGGFQFSQRIARNVEIGLSADVYDKHLYSSYQSFTNPDGSNINQTLHLQEVPVGVTIRLIPTNRRARIAPFIGVGADLIFWKYEEYGNFVDPNTLNISPDSFQSTGVTPGVHVEGGVRIPLSYDVSLVATGKYLWAKADMGDDFVGNRIDLGGASATIGINFHF